MWKPRKFLYVNEKFFMKSKTLKWLTNIYIKIRELIKYSKCQNNELLREEKIIVGFTIQTSKSYLRGVNCVHSSRIQTHSLRESFITFVAHTHTD